LNRFIIFSAKILLKIIKHFKCFKMPSGDETSQQDQTDRLAKLIDAELNLTQECLMRNPKSYSSWHHRFLMLQRHPKPDFLAEMALCERALSIDCRNFHCWDHCRSLARLANFDAVEQFRFASK
jgi:geranylgeranyl transferase type-2 subunit alpha